MPAPLSVKKNNYIENPKRSDVPTPLGVCKFLANLFQSKYEIKNMLDPCYGDGNLTRYFRDVNVVGFELKKGDDFLKSIEPINDIDLVICNPPFNQGVGKEFMPMVFLKKIIELCGNKVPIILFTPMGMRLNQRKKSKRWRELRDLFPRITTIISLPLDIFDGVAFHNEIVCFNTDKLEAHYFLDEQYLENDQQSLF